MFDLIKTHEDILLAFVENKTLDPENKNVLGMFNTLRAYDAERYIPELRDNTKITETEPVVINAHNTSGHKLPKAIEAIVKETEVK